MFMKRMENNHQGDLTDILRASGSGTIPAEWQFTSSPINYPSNQSEDHFGHPFTHIKDPILSGFGAVDEMKMRPSNIFSRMLQISPNANKLQLPLQRDSSAAGMKAPGRVLKGPILVPDGHTNLMSPNNSSLGVQIPSPRNAGIKRRKGQAKKVVCIPAPAPLNSRPSGEVVPSDLWAWRKYGQKPIKGSPYPRGYYRCSSSKGCLARKQVERSRTDPNMLVITYTSEHNHPWPTQRNALAGSTRTHQTKNASTSAKNIPSNPDQAQKQTSPKQEVINTENDVINPIVKGELDLDLDFDMKDAEIEDVFLKSYKPEFLENSVDSFFVDLGEIETDPLDLIFTTQGFSGCDDLDNKELDPFSFYDWAGSNATSSTTNAPAVSGGESKMDSRNASLS